MLEYTFRGVVESVRNGETDRYATNSNAKPGDLVMLISGRPAGAFNHVENQPDENPLRAVVEISQVEAGPLGIRSFLRWNRLVFGSTTPTYQAELAFDRSGHPRYDRLVAISKRNRSHPESECTLNRRYRDSLSFRAIRRILLNISCEGISITGHDFHFRTNEMFSWGSSMSPDRLEFKAFISRPCTLDIRFRGVNGYSANSLTKREDE
jgi:hypothetical protein